MIKYLIKFCEWFLKQNGYLVIKQPNDDVYQFIVGEVARIDSAPQSGEWKRHQVYANALKKFPDENKRSIAYMIEQALVDSQGIWTR